MRIKGRTALTGWRAPSTLLALAVAWGAAAAPPLSAQGDSIPTVEERGAASGERGAPDGVSAWPEGAWKFGGSMGMPGFGMQPFPIAFTLGVHAHYFPTGPMGVEGSLGLAPVGIVLGGVLATGGRAGITVPLRTESFLVVPSGGLSFLAGASPDGVDAGPGLFYVGLTTISRAGLRLGATIHWADRSGGPVWLVEVGGIRF